MRSNQINEFHDLFQVLTFKVFYLSNKEESFLYVNCFYWEKIATCVSVCVCVCVCVCVYVGVFISFHHKGFSWLNKTINVMPVFRSAMVCWGNISVSRIFVFTSKTVIERTFKLETVQNSVNQTRQSHKKKKATLINLLKSNGKSAKHSYLPPH